MNSKEYTLPNGKKAVFEYDACGVGKMTLECMDELMSMVADRPQWVPVSESLPELDEDGYSAYVLISFSNCTLPCIGQLRKTDGETHWYEGDDEKALDSFGLHVNAWMQLPERYTESEDKE